MSGDNLNFGAATVITPEMRAMGIGDASNDANLTQPADHTPDKDAAFLGELTELFNNSEPEDVQRVEQNSRFGEDGLKPDVQNPGDAATTEGTPPAQSDGGQEAALTDPGDPIPGLPPTGDALDPNSPSPGGDAGTGQVPHPGQSPIATPPEFDLNILAKEILGGEVNEQKARALLQMARDMERMSPVQAYQMQQMLSGAVPQPGYQPPATQPPYQPKSQSVDERRRYFQHQLRQAHHPKCQ